MDQYSGKMPDRTDPADKKDGVPPDGRRSSPLQNWLLAARPKTLLLSVTPVIAGTALALHDRGEASLVAFVLALAAAAAIQIGTNLWNDVCDGANGTDDSDRLGPQRVTAAGLIAAETVRRSAIMVFLAAAICGLGLVFIGGWPILIAGVLSLICGLLYSAGPRPIAATPLGEVFVFVFFGLIAVTGTYYLHTGNVTSNALLFGAVVGLPAMAVLLINNHRDRAGDERNGRKTLAIVIGERSTRHLYGVILGLSLVGAAVLAWPVCVFGSLAFLPAISAAILLSSGVVHQPISTRLNATLARTAGFQALLVLTVIITWLICAV